MEKLFLALIIILMLLAVPYFYKLYGLKQISKSDIPEKGDWVELSEETYILNGSCLMIQKK